MDAYVYQADLYCAVCTQEIIDGIGLAARPADPEDESSVAGHIGTGEGEAKIVAAKPYPEPEESTP